MNNTPGRPGLPAVDFDWDPSSWQEIGERILQLCTSVSTQWNQRRPSPPRDLDVLSRFDRPLPESPVDVELILRRVEEDLISGAAFNGHPSWFAYITASPLPISVLGGLLESALNQNTALWRLSPAATAIELETLDWIKHMVGFPQSAEGIFTSGGQMANIVAHAVVRDSRAPWDFRRSGFQGDNHPSLRVYASAESHYCHPQAAELLGMGRDAVRLVPVDESYAMRTDLLKTMIAEDRSNGDLPVAVIGTAGTVGTGAVDPLQELREVANAEDIWFHVDGAYGAFAALAPSRPKNLEGMASADSIACDPHKWLYSPIDAGVVLIKESGLLERSFSFHASYLATDSGQKVDLLERSPENTRPFRALKVWLALQLYAVGGYRRMIERNIQLSAYMEQLINERPELVLSAPRQLSIVCWRVEPPGLAEPKLERLQLRIIQELEARGISMVSNAVLAEGRNAIRACIVNFRTGPEEVEALVNASSTIGIELSSTV